MGMSEVLRSIKSAEEAAEKRLTEAHEDAPKIGSAARRKSSETVQNAADETVAMTQKILDSAREDAQKEADQVKAAGAKEVANIEKSSISNQDSAVEIVVNALASE